MNSLLIFAETYIILLRNEVMIKRTPWPQSSNELYRPSDRRLSAKLVKLFADRGCHVVSVGHDMGCKILFLQIHGRVFQVQGDIVVLNDTMRGLRRMRRLFKNNL
jgi:hypothetical protein